MLTKNKISVIIITGNEEKNLRDCLISVKWADEIIVVDCESKDRTVEIAKEFTDKVYTHKWQGYAAQKNYALSLTSNDWVLSLDADERIKKDLAEEIINKDFSNSDGYYIHRENYFLGKIITGCGWGTDYQLRLFKKSKTTLSERLVHEKFNVDGEVDRLKNSIIHYSYTSLADGFNKINHYSTLKAQEKSSKEKATAFKIIFIPLIAFIQHYFIRRGIKDGKHGLMVSLMHAVTKLQEYMKIWEIKK